MAKSIFPSSFRCDCGHESHFFENTVRELKEMSIKKREHLGDGEQNEHTIVFQNGEATEIQCPELGTCKITNSE